MLRIGHISPMGKKERNKEEEEERKIKKLLWKRAEGVVKLHISAGYGW